MSRVKTPDILYSVERCKEEIERAKLSKGMRKSILFYLESLKEIQNIVKEHFDVDPR